ncbi:MAG: amino acid transporter, partial [Armatimonadota bacterium]|nr:amino acid transporter [Armatimonadota bacterium]
LVVIGTGFYQIALHPELLANWKEALFAKYSNPLLMVAAALLLFPKLALGLSGFETGVVVMPLVRGDANDDPERPAGRIGNARKLLTGAALIMSVLLMTSSFVTTVLIPHEAFVPAEEAAKMHVTNPEIVGKASGRALAFLAHEYLGEAFGTIYDISTILILWFAGASALAGLLNIVPRYLPRYGMAPDWTRATRPLVLIFTAICFLVTILFKADVEAQGGAYATGVLTLMASAAVAVTLSAWREGSKKLTYAFGLITAVFIYTTAVNIKDQPEGLKIACFFIAAIIATSLISRVMRTTELRVQRIEIDETARRFIQEIADSSHSHEIHIVANKRQVGDLREYVLKEDEIRVANYIPAKYPILFLEVTVPDASEFEDVLEVRGEQVGDYKILRAEYAAVPNAIAAFLFHLRDTFGLRPHAYFAWSEGSPLVYLFRYVLLGEGDTAPVTREILRKYEADPARRPAIHVAG